MAFHSLNFPLHYEAALKKALVERGFTFHPLQHGYWQARNNNSRISLYNTGKIVIDGNEQDITSTLTLLQTWMQEAISELGFDECGKGDVFGPLVLAGVGIRASEYPRLRMLGISESKQASSAQLQYWYQQILASCQVETFVLEPVHYNEWYARYGNINTILTIGYQNLLKRFSSGWEKVIVDAYTLNEKTKELLATSSPGPFLLETKGERFLSVGAASIVARQLFLNWFENQPFSLPRGSGEKAKKLFFQLRDKNPHEVILYAKMHFFSQ